MVQGPPKKKQHGLASQHRWYPETAEYESLDDEVKNARGTTLNSKRLARKSQEISPKYGFGKLNMFFQELWVAENNGKQKNITSRNSTGEERTLW